MIQSVTQRKMPNRDFDRPFTENVIPQLCAWRRAGIPSALLTLVNVVNSGPRKIGSQMAVNVNGESVGYMSGGCAEAAIISEAVETIITGQPRCVRYGVGSKYFDIILPCGSGIDIYFDPWIKNEILYELERAILSRLGASLILDLDLNKNPVLSIAGREKVSWVMDKTYTKTYSPVPRVVIAGKGVGIDYLARFANELEWQVIVATPDEDVLNRVRPYVFETQNLSKPEQFNSSVIDSDTAIVLLFHDHDWEPKILVKSQEKTPFYIGALGSRKTHAARKEILQQLGCDTAFIKRIHGPVGLDINAKNPATIAVSIIAQIIDDYENKMKLER